MIILILGILIVLTRVIEFNLFIKKISKKCHRYDCKHVDANPDLFITYLADDYHLKCEWSAYKFMFLNGPTPISIFFSLKILTFDNIYKKEILERVSYYENI